MERVNLKYKDAIKAWGTLRDIFKEPFTVIVRDAAIQRFEYTFEALWKFLKEHLKQNEGIISNSPKACFRELFSLGFLTEKETVKFLEMTDSRNDTSHTYKEKVAEAIYAKIEEYVLLMGKLLENLKSREN